jgi:hypothetical protein
MLKEDDFEDGRQKPEAQSMKMIIRIQRQRIVIHVPENSRY